MHILIQATSVLMLAVLAILLIREVLGYFKLSSYTKQGFKSIFYPIFGGEISVLMKAMKNKNHMSLMNSICLAAKREGKKGLVFNGIFGQDPMLYLIEPNIIREFFIKETECSKRAERLDIKISIGMLFMPSVEALEMRALFTEFFKIDNVNSLLPLLKKGIDARLDGLNYDLSGAVQGIRSKQLVREIFIDSANILLFGNDAGVQSDTGKTFSEELTSILDTMYSDKVLMNPLNAVLADLPNRWNLLSASRQAKAKADHLADRFLEYLQRRTAAFSPEAGSRESPSTPINIALRFNHAAAAGKRFDLKTLVGQFNGFFLAFETSRSAMEAALYFLAVKPDIQEDLRRELATLALEKEAPTIEKLDEMPLLRRFIAESLRVLPPGPLLLERRLLRDVIVGGCKLAAGTRVNVPLGPIMWDEDNFKSGNQFDIDALNDQNKKFYHPFSMGKRNCSGQVLIDAALKLMVAVILQRFRVALVGTPDDLEYQFNFTMMLAGCEVRLTRL